MATAKRRTGGRTTPKGTRPGDRLDHHDPTHVHGTHEVGASSRYTPPVPKYQKQSPPWVPYVMFALLGIGALVILLFYLGAVPGGRSNWYLFGGLAMVLGGLFTATQYR